MALRKKPASVAASQVKKNTPDKAPGASFVANAPLPQQELEVSPHGGAGGGEREHTKQDLIQMGSTAVREALEAQGRYSRKRKREHAVKGSTGEDNKIRMWARLMGITLGYTTTQRLRKRFGIRT